MCPQFALAVLLLYANKVRSENCNFSQIFNGSHFGLPQKFAERLISNWNMSNGNSINISANCTCSHSCVYFDCPYTVQVRINNKTVVNREDATKNWCFPVSGLSLFQIFIERTAAATKMTQNEFQVFNFSIVDCYNASREPSSENNFYHTGNNRHPLSDYIVGAKKFHPFIIVLFLCAIILVLLCGGGYIICRCMKRKRGLQKLTAS